MKTLKFPMTWLALATTVLLAGCATPAPALPEAERPATPVFAAAPELARSGPAARWAALGDAALAERIERALARNLDLAQAAERVQRSRALAAAADAARWPSLSASASGSERDDRQRSSSASAGLDLAWEVDLFGRLGSLRNAAELRSAAAQADADAVRRAVAAEVAQAWYALWSADEQLQLTRAVIDNRRNTLELVRHRTRAGFSAPLDEARARSDLAAAQADVPTLEAQRSTALHRLAVLGGEAPGGHPLPAAPTAVDPAALTLSLPAGEVWLASRPDIAAAEARLRALAMDEKAVRAEFLPRLSVGGFVGWLAGSAVGLSSAGTSAWVVAPSVTLPVFDAGRLQARLAAAQAEQREALLHYRQRLLLAQEDVENALTRVSLGRGRLQALQERSQQAVRAEQLARLRYQAGASDLLELLDAQRTAQQAQIGLAQALGQHRQDVALLLRALGAV